jgi:hypothetical protein
MKTRLKHIWLQSLWFTLFIAQCVASPPHAADAPAGDEALRQGEAMYLHGVLPSGAPLQATIFGNLTQEGEAVACAACHLRSGMGKLLDDMETLVLPVSGAKLYAPLLGQENIPGVTMKRLMFENPRPAYTDQTLAAALLTGKDPTGRSLNQTMPRYLLDEESMRVMISYLKSLSATISPGVTEDEIRFATIVGEGISVADRDAMLLPLIAFLQLEWNERLSDHLEQVSARISHKGRPAPGKRYRKATLDVWQLHGPPETWADQLKTFNTQRPVFALLAGIVPGGWSPIHEFCEKNRIPCLLPITDLPGLAEDDWYTLYFSKGLSLEGEVAAKFLAQDAGLPLDTPVIQVSRKTDEGKALAGSFSETWKKLSEVPLTTITLSPNEQTGSDFWKKLSAANPQAAFVVWLAAADLTGIESLADGKQPPPALTLSATLLGGALPAMPDKIRDFTYIVHPARLPGEGDSTETIVADWLNIKDIPNTNMTISAKVFVLKGMLSKALVAMGNDYHRDFFLDLLDGAKEQATASVTYPVLSFGPGQRYAANGCYVVQLTRGEKPELVKKVDWFFYLRQR